MSDQEPTPLVRRAGDIEYEDVPAADGLRKGVLIGEEHGAPTLAIRRFTLAPGAEVPRHTNEIEHEQYVLSGEYVVGIADGSTGSGSEDTPDGETEYTVSEGDATFVPAGTVHWYRNESDEEAAFVCAVPVGDDEIRVLDKREEPPETVD